MPLVNNSWTTRIRSSAIIHALLRTCATRVDAGRLPAASIGPAAAVTRRPRSAPGLRRRPRTVGAVGSAVGSSAAGTSPPWLMTSPAASSGSAESARRLYAARSRAGSSASSGGQLAHDPPAEDDDRAVADELDLLELGGVQQDRRARLGEVAQQHVDLVLRADVDAAGGVEAEHDVDAARDPARDRDLLLVAARQAPDLVAGPRVDLERLDGAVDHLPLAREVDEAPLPEPGVQREGDVLANRALHQQRVRAIGRDVDDPGADGVPGVPERHRPAVDGEVAAGRAVAPREDVEQLVLALALEGDDADDLARVDLERDVLELGAQREAASGRAAASCPRLVRRPDPAPRRSAAGRRPRRA